MTISKNRYMNYLKVQKSGTINMFGYDREIQANYNECYKHFVDNKSETDFVEVEE